MSWETTAFDWNRARAFLATAEEGSYSAAARALGLAQPTLGRQVGALEEELGVTLFERVGNRLELTETGLALLEHVRAMKDAAERVSLTATGQAETLEGTVRLAASEAVSAFLLPPIIGALRLDHPAIEIELIPSNESSDLRRREADIAVRNYRPGDPELISRKIGDSVAWLYAAPAYLDRIGRPTTSQALAERAEVIGFDRSDMIVRRFNELGVPLRQANFRIRTANHLVQWELVKRGVAMAVMMEEVGDPEPLVERVLPEIGPIAAFPTWLTCHRELKTSRRIRVVFERLADGLTAGVRSRSAPPA